MVNVLSKKLNSWGHKHVSLGGRLVLLNSVLNSIPIFYLSFMRMPVQVIKKVTRIQRDFLWGGVNGGWKLSWVKWRVVCQDKKNGGLGVRDIKAVNLSLLMKWRWRLLNNDDVGLWKEVLVAKYGNHITQNAAWSFGSNSYLASPWWRDICDLEGCVDSKNWVVESVSRCLGDGGSTRFWRDKWVGDSLLCDRFPRLFSISSQKEAMVNELVVVEGEVMTWNFSWRRRLFVWEDEIVVCLLGVLESVRFSNNVDSWRWLLASDGCFSVKSAYESLSKDLVVGSNFPMFEAKIFKDIWCSPAPSKVIVFSWQILHDRVPTKDNLILRGILPHDNDGFCVWCGNVPETSSHLFLHCKAASVVWYEIFRWLGVIIVLPPNLFYLFYCLSEAARSIKDRIGFRFI
jgi:hypothetical protein